MCRGTPPDAATDSYNSVALGENDEVIEMDEKYQVTKWDPKFDDYILDKVLDPWGLDLHNNPLTFNEWWLIQMLDRQTGMEGIFI